MERTASSILRKKVAIMSCSRPLLPKGRRWLRKANYSGQLPKSSWVTVLLDVGKMVPLDLAQSPRIQEDEDAYLAALDG
jgi:hypothetical protein